MNFDNVRVLSANSRSQFFGEQVRWKSNLELNIEGSVLYDGPTEGYSEIHTLLNTLETNAFGTGVFYTSITINGVNFGSGYVSNFSSSGDDVDINEKKYTLTVSIPVEGNLTDLNSGDFAGLGFTNFKYLDSFSESSTFIKGEGLKDTYTQSINLTVSPPIKSDGKTYAETIVKNFLNNNNLTSLIVGTYQKSVKKFYNQTYDTLANTYSVSISYEVYPRQTDSTEQVLVIKNVSVDYGSEGVVTITENGTCVGNTAVSNSARFTLAINKAKELSSGSFSRCQTSMPVGSHNPLLDYPISKSFTTNEYEGSASYSVTFTNSKEIAELKGYHTYNLEVQTTASGQKIAVENGSVIGGKEVKSTKDKYNNAVSLWATLKGVAIARVIDASDTGNLILESETHSEVEGRINYSYSYTNNTSIRANQEIRKVMSTISIQGNRRLSSNFNIVGKKEIIQIQPNLLHNEHNINITINGKYKTSIDTYLTEAKKSLTSSQFKYPSSVEYSLNPSEREFTLTATYFELPS
jgi:hypothetical protein